MYITFRSAATFFLGTLVAATAQAQDCCQPVVQEVQPAYRVVYQTVYEQQPVTVYRLEYETVFEEQQVTVQRPVWETEYRERRYTVAKPVVETAEREERYTVMRPVWETSYRDQSYDRVHYVTETEMREQRHVVSRPVMEQTYRDQQRVVRRPVVETVMQNHSYTAYDPVTTMQTQYVDQGSYVNSVAYAPGPVRNRLQFLPGAYAVDPLTGLTYWRRGGFYWVPTAAPGAYVAQQQYVPNVVAVQQPQTTYVARVVTEQRPVEVTKYVDEVITEKVPVQVCRMEQQEEVRQVPVTVQKPVVERVNCQVPVRTCRWVEQEMVRKIPVTTQRIVHEERVDNVAVQVCRMVTETRAVQRPRTVASWKPYTATQTVPRTVVMHVPVDACSAYSESPTTSYYYPAAPATETPDPALAVPPPAEGVRTQRAPAAEAADDESSVLEPTPAPSSDRRQQEGPAGDNDQPQDTDETGRPTLDPEDAPPLTAPGGQDSARATSHTA